ncbi:MAG: Ig-like domain-containing protein [Deltaproteobacteria bacterium]|nr:Ig-like domain-containing protein [Deltaproteobacteria bacterium]
MKSRLITLVGFLLGMQTATAQWAQEGPKLVGTGAVGGASQGYSVATSSDGNTAIVGGLSDNGDAGAAWIWTRSGGVWTQQGPKLVGTGAVGSAQQGRSVSISSDGNTAIVGGQGDNSYEGAAWIWTRSGGVWTQQGPKLVGTGAIGDLPQLGYSVSISSDGNTAIVGGSGDGAANSYEGAVWIWTRSGGVWTQQGPKLVGTGAIGSANQGGSVSISGDGTTALVGGPGDDGSVGATWVFTVAAPGASQLAFVQQPTTTVAGATISPAVTVQLQDGSGNPVSTAGVTVTLSLTSGTGALSGTLSQLTDSTGLATFSNLSIDLVGSKQLTAASTGLTPAVSSFFNITAGAAAIITVTGGGTQSTSIGTLFALPLQVTVTDALLNPVSGAVVTFSAPGSGASAVLSNGGSATTNANGQASVTATANFVAGGPYTVTATVGTLPPANFSLTNLQDAVDVIPTLGGVGLIGFALLLAAVGVLGAGGAFKS